MTIKLAFCNDCDLQTWKNYQIVHHELRSRGLTAGDSFWLFDPSGGEFGLFKRDCTEKGPFHDELLEEISSGRLDVMHSVGSYGARFSQGLRPERKLTAQALEYLARHARVPRIWTNHGDESNRQNIGGAVPAHYHDGDLPGSEAYVLDLLVDHGVKYFWLDRHLTMYAHQPVRLVASETTRSGHRIEIFNRFMGTWPLAPNGQNLHKQLNDENLRHWLANRQNVVIYQHWTCHHTSQPWAYTPTEPPLTQDSLAALDWLREKQSDGTIEVVPLQMLLDEESRKPEIDEIDRIAKVSSQEQATAADNHYYFQFHKHTVRYFQSRIDHLSPKGERALDAGCGAGQWSLCLGGSFSRIDAFDSSQAAINLAQQIANSARVPIEFTVRDIYDTKLPSDCYDFVLCYGVIFLVECDRALAELYRVMKPGASCFLSVNGDGWYHYLVDERFKERADEERQIYVSCLWNAYVARCGGEARLAYAARSLRADLARAASGADRGALAGILKQLLAPASRNAAGDVLDRYSHYIHAGFADRVERLVTQVYGERAVSWKARARQAVRQLASRLTGAGRLDVPPPDSKIPLFNRPYLPEEFEAVAAAAGFVNFRWGRDASLSLDDDKPSSEIAPLHELKFAGNNRVWECLITKPGAA